MHIRFNLNVFLLTLARPRVCYFCFWIMYFTFKEADSGFCVKNTFTIGIHRKLSFSTFRSRFKKYYISDYPQIVKCDFQYHFLNSTIWFLMGVISKYQDIKTDENITIFWYIFIALKMYIGTMDSFKNWGKS